MIPAAYVQEWSHKAPWPDSRQVEQDLVICRALCDLFNSPAMTGKVAFRGGTAIHKLLFRRWISTRLSGVFSITSLLNIIPYKKRCVIHGIKMFGIDTREQLVEIILRALNCRSVHAFCGQEKEERVLASPD